MTFVFSACGGAESLVETLSSPVVPVEDTPPAKRMSTPVDPLKNAVEILSVRCSECVERMIIYMNIYRYYETKLN